MFLQPRVKSVGTIGEFMNDGVDIKKLKNKVDSFNRKFKNTGIKAVVTAVAGMTAVRIITPLQQAHAQEVAGPVTNYVSQKVTEKIVEGFMPLVELVKALSYPIAFIMLTAGALFIMIGQKDKGYSMLTQASIGYVLVQLSPLLMKMLVEVGNTVALATPILALI